MIRKLDLFGISASLACAVHCSVLPLAITGGFLSKSFLAGHGVIEYIFIGISIILAFSSLIKSYVSIHKNATPIILFLIGFIAVMFGLINHGYLEIVLASAGGIAIASAHFHNYILNKNINLESEKQFNV